LFALVLVLSFSLVTALLAAADTVVTLATDNDGIAEWSTQYHSGTYSVKMTAPVWADYAKVEIAISEPFSGFTAPSFYYKIADDAVDTGQAPSGALVKSGDAVATGFRSPFLVIEISDGSATHWIISQCWASNTQVDWTLWDNTQASTVYSEALWHDEGAFDDPPTEGGQVGWGPLS